jgi:uncharacterized protein YodC (DUF2158 family)
MSEVEFKRGDIVRLKSGGPKMNVEKIDKNQSNEERSVECSWSDKDHIFRDVFFPETLEYVTKSPISVVINRTRPRD